MLITNHRNRVFILDQEDKFLILIRKFKNGTRSLLLPGGGVDEGETSQQALVREVKEELGISLDTHNLKIVLNYRESREVRKLDIDYHPHLVLGRDSIEDVLDFYYIRVEHSFKPKIKETEKFDDVLWVKSVELADVAVKHNAVIGDGIMKAISSLSKEVTGSPAFSNW